MGAWRDTIPGETRTETSTAGRARTGLTAMAHGGLPANKWHRTIVRHMSPVTEPRPGAGARVLPDLDIASSIDSGHGADVARLQSHDQRTPITTRK